MRVVRRIAGEVYMDGSDKTDYEVRRNIGVPSIDCRIQRNRLQYLGRITRRHPSASMALLQTCDEHGQPILPWVSLVASDLTRMRFCVKEVSNLLLDP